VSAPEIDERGRRDSATGPKGVQRFALKAAVALLSCLVVPVVSYSGDAGHVFHARDYVDRVGGYLRQGYNVEGVENLDERLLQAQIIHDLPAAPALAVFGSSRAMILSSDLLHRPLVNNGMSGASIDDLFAIYQMYRERGFEPDTVMLCLDPWMLNERYDDVRWKSIAAEANSMRRLLGLTDATGRSSLRQIRSGLGVVRLRLQEQLLSPDYFRSSLEQLWRRSFGGETLTPTRESRNTVMTRLADGAITYGKAYEQRTPVWVAGDATRFLAMNPIYGFRDFTSVTPRQRDAMTRFLEQMRSDGVQVELVLLPYHPTVYQSLRTSDHYVGLEKVEGTIKSIAAAMSLTVAGSYSPAALGLGPADFYDAMHPRSAPSAAIAEAALAH
jgi:hypothetical protein